MEAWTDLYTELAENITDKLPQVTWVDLWHDQIQFLTEELPFPTPAVFIAFNTKGIADESLLIQDCDIQVDFYLFYETFSDTYQGAYNQNSAIEYLRMLTDLHTLFHGQSGTNFETMRRVDMRQEESGGSGNLYRISFECIVNDASAKKALIDKPVNEINLTRAPITRAVDETPLYSVDTN